MVTLADLLRPDRPADLPLIMLAGLRNTVSNTIVPPGLHQYVTLAATWWIRMRSSHTSPSRWSDDGPPSPVPFSASMPHTSSTRFDIRRR